MSYYVDPPRNLQIVPTQPTYKSICSFYVLRRRILYHWNIVFAP